MKITIKNGESVDNALKYLSDFLNERKDEYPILAGNLNIYVSLKGFGELICPENNKDYILTRNGVIDLEETRINESREFALDGWKKYMSAQRKQLDSAKHKVSLDVEYLKTAEKKQRKPETIEKRKMLLEKNRVELENAEKTIQLLNSLNAHVLENKIKWHYLKKCSKNAPYSYNISPSIIFENVNGETWHFTAYKSRYDTPYGFLKKGFPKPMNNA